MNRRDPASITPSSPQTEKTDSFAQRLWRWFIEPSREVAGPDQRRQAALLSGFLLGLIVLAIVIEAITDALIDWASYTGYRQTIGSILVLAVVYSISRTRYFQLAAGLAVLVTVAAVFLTGWSDPRSVLGGLFDYLILPLWLGSLFIDLKRLSLLIAAVLAGLCLFPLAAPQVMLKDILIGPFSFIFTTSILLLVITRHRNRLEEDRREELTAKEQRSRREAARAEALLRVAGRLNAQLDLEALLAAACEEVTRALGAPVCIVTLYDPKHDQLYTAGGSGLPADVLKNMPLLPRSVYDEAMQTLGRAFAISDLQETPSLPYLTEFKKRNLRSLAFAAMEYEQELIGSLVAVTVGEVRDFAGDELLLLKGLADQAALAIVSTRLYKDARRRLENLQALHTIETTIAANHHLRENLQVMLENITAQLHVDAAVFLLLDESRQQLEYAGSLGFNTPTLRFTRLRLGEGIAGRAAQQRTTIHIPDLRTDPQTLIYAPTLAKEGFASYYATPLIAQGRVNGVLEIFHRGLLDPDEEWLDFLEALAGQAAIAIENTSLFEGLQRANADLSRAYDSTIEGWSRALDLRDKETEGHTQRVTELTLVMARAFGVGDAALVHVRRGGLLHDIGKMGIPDSILLKEGPLTPDEWEIMRRHPVYAHEMLLPITYLRPALDIPYCHHEKWDGSGYPRGLEGGEIPLTARIFALVDVWDALTSDRPYRKAWPEQRVREHVRAAAGSHFDPDLVEPFLKLLEGA